MTARLRIVAESPAYRVAVAGLPSRAELVDSVAGSIVVVDGSTEWWDAVEAAVEADAAAVLVAEPLEVPTAAVRELAGAGVPIIVQRSRLRSDLVAVALDHRDGVAPRVVVAECTAPTDRFPLLARDAVGWLRTLVAEPLTVMAASEPVSSGSRTALLRSKETGVPGSIVMTTTGVEGMMLRVQALGEITTELEIDEPFGRTELATSTARGRLVAPPRFERSERQALRRAIEAVGHGAPVSDLEQLRHDTEAAALITRSASADLFS